MKQDKPQFLYRSLYGCIILFIFTVSLTAQTAVDSLGSRIQDAFVSCPAELTYFQTSKDVYETGEDLWFKGYQFDSQTFGLSAGSKTVYLQLIAPTDSVVWQEKYPVLNGIVSGHIYIDEKLPIGDYRIEGYSIGSFYKDDTLSLISSRKIRIVNDIAKASPKAVVSDSSFRFSVFPEGGNLVDGLPAKLAFKATDGKGNPKEAEGVLYNNDKAVGVIRSVHDGMGSILFTPRKEGNYRIELSNGNEYALPNIQAEGMSLLLQKQGSKELEFIASQSDAQGEQTIYLVGQMRGMVCCIAQGKLKESIKLSIPKSHFLYQGIAEFTLYNEALQPMAERLVYLHPEKKLHITAEPDKKKYATREKATVKVSVKDENNNPVKAHLGISVYDDAYTDKLNPTTMLNYCFLTSQVRGSVHNPDYYFNDENKDRLQALDLLLLTQGWRRYIWTQSETTYKGVPFLTDEINGRMYSKAKKKQQFAGTEQFIQVSGPEANAMLIGCDTTGLFSLPTESMMTLRGGYVYLKPMTQEEYKPEIELEEFFPSLDSLRKQRPGFYSWSSAVEAPKEQRFSQPVVSKDSTILLDEVTVTGKGRKPFRDKFMGRLDSLAQLDLNGAWVCTCPDPSTPYLNDYEFGYTHHPHGLSAYAGKRLAPIPGKQYRLIKYEPNNNGDWYLTAMKTVVYNGPVYTEEELLRMNNLWRTKGYYGEREFYQPDEIDIQSSMPDARNTLLWAPTVVTDEKGEATVSFYCSDINTGFISVIEGTDGTGLLGFGRCDFRVMKSVAE